MEELGIPTAKPIMPTKQFISYPISQALIRSGDKKISKILQDHGFNKYREEDPGTIADYLSRWLLQPPQANICAIYGKRIYVH